MLDFDLIVKKCNLFEDVDANVVIKNISALEQEYSEEELILIYNYILSNVKNPDILTAVIRLTDKYRDKSTLPILVDLLLMNSEQNSSKEKFIHVRSMCAKAIANYKDTGAVTPLLYCLNNKDENYKVRLSCADALGKIGDKYAVAPLIDVVKDEEEKSVYLRESAASALGLLGDMRAIDPLVTILETKQGLMNKFTFLKERVIEALSRLTPDNDRAFNAIKKTLHDENPQVRINAIEAIMNYEHAESYGLIKQMLKDENQEVVQNAITAIYNLEGEKGLNEIIDNPQYTVYCREEAKMLLENEKDCENT